MFYDNFVLLCANRGKSPSGVAREIGLSNAAANGWKRGKMPNDTTLAKLSNYFGVPASSLTDEKKETPISEDGREEDLKLKVAAYWGGGDDLSQEELDGLWNDAESYYKFKLEQMRQKKRSKQ